MKKTMKKLLLLVAFAAASLVGCDLKDSTPVVFQYDNYAYVVHYSAGIIPADVIAVEVTYLDADGQTKKEKVAKSWFKTVPAKKGFIMKMTSKLVWADGKGELTSGDELNYTIDAGVSGVVNGQPEAGKWWALKGYSASSQSPNAYTFLNTTMGSATPTELEYEIKPILEPKM